MVLGLRARAAREPRVARTRRLSHGVHPADPGARHRHRRDLEADVQLRLRRDQPACSALDRPAAGTTGSAIARRRSPSVIVVDIWHWTPFVFLLLLAGLESCRRTCTRRRASTARRLAGAALRHAAADAADALVTLAVPADRRVQGLRRGLPADRRRPGHRHRGGELHDLSPLLHRGPDGLRRRRCR